MKFLVRQTVTYYASVEAASEDEALEIAEDLGRIDLEDVDTVEENWELVEQS